MVRVVSHKKLVRDLIPEIIRKNGAKAKTTVLSQKAFKTALLEKLVEEVHEVVGARTKEELISELADVQEVMNALYSAYRIECSDVTNTARKKRKQRGAFTKRIFLVSTTE